MEESIPAEADAVLAFWFGDAIETSTVGTDRQRLWFGGGPGLDREIATRFGALVEAALADGLPAWRASARGRLALVILLDQFTRNVFRGTARAFAGDAQARALARASIDAPLARLERLFLLLPFEHSEQLADQDFAVGAYHALAREAPDLSRGFFAGCAEHAEQHRAVIRSFGRFPHRNAALGRTSTEAELAWLSEGGARFGQ